MKYVVIVNGKPGSGKTTFEMYCKHYLNETEYAWCDIISSIDPIKSIYSQLGWDGKKSEKARKELSILKKIWIDNCDGPTKYILDYIFRLDYKFEDGKMLTNDDDKVVLVDIREESEIIKLTDILSAIGNTMGIKYSTVFIDRKENAGIEYGNKSDDDVGQNMSLYYYVVHNDGDHNEIRQSAIEFIEQLFKED